MVVADEFTFAAVWKDTTTEEDAGVLMKYK